MAHDFKKFPELTNAQIDFYYWDSPHTQIFETFDAKVVKVIDGDTIRVLWDERDFDFPVRFMNIAAPEKKMPGGEESQRWLEDMILGEEVTITIIPERRVDKWGRLLGYISEGGLDIGEQSIIENHSKPWNLRDDGEIPDFDRLIKGSEIK